ncbi:peptide/nickel transport system ATP-binding protein [Nonomuraea polychroma]|uniref:Nickel import system ATP-binding protein NikD n=1 Tax=Nonomuraea polychroma TaxID=46176 RepID=A0A438M3F8_9ACTN|nr:ABC transporter ATP-binding protein [Nonomuraea polychroma]RVX40335.1 peptide/nickel transport system ATP-binding protein [Nonomuraea polychroma]
MKLRVDGLSVRFRLPGAVVHAVTDARFELRPGRCLALVGESGCGKSVMAHALLGLLPANATVTGHAWLDLPSSAAGNDVIDLVAEPEKVLAQRVRGRLIGLIPQSPAAHLTPVRTARAQLAETLRELGRADTPDALAGRAGLRPRDLDRYPHQLSGGMAQRVANALALAGDPPLILADEPTTGLDRPLVDATMAELRRLCDEGRAVLVITHDLRAAERVADDIAVMYASRIVELAEAAPFFSRPRHPYAKGLLDALPTRRFVPIPGRPPELTRLPAGCAFQPRCPLATPECDDQPIMNGVACHHA